MRNIVTIFLSLLWFCYAIRHSRTTQKHHRNHIN